MIYLIIVIIIVGGDYWLKQRAEQTLTDQTDQEILGGRIRLRKLHNHGAALSFMHKWPELLKYLTTALTAATGGCLIISLIRGGSRITKLGLSMLFGGAMSNLLDRYIRGYVVDYFSFRSKWKKLARLVFNLADMFIFIGSLLVVLGSNRSKK